MPELPSAEERSNRLSTHQAAALLGVKPTTLYAYVSRGLLTSRRGHDGRTSTFDRAEVEALAARQQTSRTPGDLYRINSAITQIAETAHYYRGYNALTLASTVSFEEVANLLWVAQPPGEAASFTCSPTVLERARALQAQLPPDSPLLDRLTLVVMAAASADDFRYDTSGPGVAVAGRELLAAMVDGLDIPRPGDSRPDFTSEPSHLSPGSAGLAERLWAKLSQLKPTPERTFLLNAVLVVLADHELAPSTLAARIAAAYHADPYACVEAGITTLSGARHGRVALAHEAMFNETEIAGGRAGAALAERLRRSGSLEGPDRIQYRRLGDPRAAAILRLLGESMPGSPRLAHVGVVTGIIERRGLGRPSLELALAAVAFCCEMPYGSTEILLAIGKTPGWLAHAIEEYASPTTYAPAVNYVGARPRR